jgi:hypothetical protein
MEQDQVKVLVRLVGNEDSKIEKLWVSKLDDGLFVIDNIPFLTDQVSFRDIVKVRFDPDLQLLEVLEVYKQSNRFQTQFVVKNCSDEEKNAVLSEISQHNCFIEHARNNFYSVSLSNEASVEEFELTLQKFVKLGWLNYDGTPFDNWKPGNA